MRLRTKLLVPFLALVLMWIHLGKKLFFGEHLAFALHYQAFGFAIASVQQLLFLVHPDAAKLLSFLGFIYLYRAMQVAYERSRLGTVLSMIVLGCIYTPVLAAAQFVAVAVAVWIA